MIVERDTQRICQSASHLLKSKPLIVWGSGGTIPHGLPSMADLNEKLKKEIPGFPDNDNLEKELSDPKYKEKMDEIKKIIFSEVEAKDIAFMQTVAKGDKEIHAPIQKIISTFKGSHPENLSIVTPNYDRVLEHVMSWHGIPFTDGFNGKAFSLFDETLFEKKQIVHLIKAHGSLNWFEMGYDTRYLPNNACGASLTPKIIPPSHEKHRDGYKEPFRHLMAVADQAIKKSASFLVVGFGFNDEHITENLEAQIRDGRPIVLVTKTATDSAKEKIRKARDYFIFEREGDKATKVTHKNLNTSTESVEIIGGRYWELSQFAGIVSL